MGIPRHAFIGLAALAFHAVAFAQLPTPAPPLRIANWGRLGSSTTNSATYPTPTADSAPLPTSDSAPVSTTNSASFPTADFATGPTADSGDDPTADGAAGAKYCVTGTEANYPSTGIDSVFSTNGGPVSLPFKYYPQGAVNEDGTGITWSYLQACEAGACFCTPPPCYFGTFYVSGMILDRSTNLRPAGLIYDSTLTTEVANTSQFDFETEAGFRAGVWLTNPSGVDWNIEYFDVGNFSDSIVRENPAGLNAFFFGNSFPIPPNVAPPTSITAEYESTLDSLEFVVRVRQWRRIAPQMGFRFMQVSENFNLLNDALLRTGMLSNTDNDLYGFEFGFQGLVWEWCRSRLETTVRAGTYYNDIDVDYYEVVYDATTAQTTSQLITSFDRSWTTFSGDFRLTWVYQLGPRANFRVGYQGLWLDGIALAVNQNTTRQFRPPIQTIDISHVVYHGGEIGFELSW